MDDLPPLALIDTPSAPTLPVQFNTDDTNQSVADEFFGYAALPAVPAADVAGLVEALGAEYALDHPLETSEERMGRHSAVRGIAVRMGCYPQLEAVIDAAITHMKDATPGPYPAVKANSCDQDRINSARYQWLRSRDLDTIHMGGVFAGQTPQNLVLNGVDLDEAIDAAMNGGA